MLSPAVEHCRGRPFAVIVGRRVASQAHESFLRGGLPPFRPPSGASDRTVAASATSVVTAVSEAQEGDSVDLRRKWSTESRFTRPTLRSKAQCWPARVSASRGVLWPGVELKPGENSIELRSGDRTASAVWTLVSGGNG